MAADLIAQAEHDPDAIAIFVTTSTALAAKVAREMEVQVAALPAKNLAREALAQNGAVLVARSVAQAADFVERFAPEHWTLAGDAGRHARQFPAAGSVFVLTASFGVTALAADTTLTTMLPTASTAMTAPPARRTR